MNKTPIVAVQDMTLEEKFTRKKPNFSHFKVFGCIDYVHLPDELRTKLDPKVEKCVFIGYFVEQKCYKCYNPVTRQVRVSTDVVFDSHAIRLVQVHGYIDFDWAGSSSDRRSTGGYMFSFGSAAITWSNKNQPTVSLLSTEAEYRGETAAFEVVWLEMLLQDLEI
ncbi:hypothetical protein L7F22_050977 [Adiantum nelumboides]|nr:hypothetical protein [Adiantum nelumboides]